MQLDDTLHPTHPGDALTIRSGRDDATWVIALHGELDLANGRELERELGRAEASDVDEIVLDLGALQFVDSTGIRLLLEATQRSVGDGGRLRILRGPEHVHRVFELCGVTDALPFTG
jgi:anti-anti-sigma factor